jgi:hypothetical protein
MHLHLDIQVSGPDRHVAQVSPLQKFLDQDPQRAIGEMQLAKAHPIVRIFLWLLVSDDRSDTASGERLLMQTGRSKRNVARWGSANQGQPVRRCDGAAPLRGAPGGSFTGGDTS